MLRIFHPPTYPAERAYIYDTMLRSFLGLDVQTEIDDRPDVRITLTTDPSERSLTFDDTLFSTSDHLWLTDQSLPEQPIRRRDLFAANRRGSDFPDDTPILYADRRGDDDVDASSQDQISAGFDLFGSAFVMLTRYEEIAHPVYDRHQRFPATASLAYRAGFLDRPVVNEYVEYLWACLQRLWPRLERKRRAFRLLLSHDVDWPVVTLRRSWPQTIRAATGDLAKRRDPALAARRLRSHSQVRRGNWDADVGNAFDFMMATNERHGLRGTFNFIAGHTAGDIDGTYALADPWIRGLLRRIAQRGHEIGLHPSYNTFLDPAATKAELDHLVATCAALGITQARWGGRQHYLRWRNPTTWQNWSDAGLAYDSTLGFADEVGFRCGVCFEYPVFNLLTRQSLGLTERPLIAMDATLMGDSDRPGGSVAPAEAIRMMAALKHRCQLYHGDFTLLWHNTWLLQESQQAAYRECVDVLAR